MASLVMQLALGILVAICPWFELYLVLRFILGFVCVSIVFSGFVLCAYSDRLFDFRFFNYFFILKHRHGTSRREMADDRWSTLLASGPNKLYPYIWYRVRMQGMEAVAVVRHVARGIFFGFEWVSRIGT